MGALIAQMQGIEASAISVADYGEEIDDFGPDFSQTMDYDRDESTFRHGQMKHSVSRRGQSRIEDFESQFSRDMIEENKEDELVVKAREKKEAEFFAQLEGLTHERDTIRASVIDLTEQLEEKSKNVNMLYNEKETIAKQLAQYQEQKKKDEEKFISQESEAKKQFIAL